jgi:hypothetical protein
MVSDWPAQLKGGDLTWVAGATRQPVTAAAVRQTTQSTHQLPVPLAQLTCTESAKNTSRTLHTLTLGVSQHCFDMPA